MPPLEAPAIAVPIAHVSLVVYACTAPPAADAIWSPAVIVPYTSAALMKPISITLTFEPFDALVSVIPITLLLAVALVVFLTVQSAVNSTTYPGSKSSPAMNEWMLRDAMSGDVPSKIGVFILNHRF